MKDEDKFDFPCSPTFREGLLRTIDYRTSRTYSGADRPPSKTSRFADQVLDDLEQENRGLRSTMQYWQQRAIRAEAAEEQLRAECSRNTRQKPRKPFDGPEEPLT